MSGINKCIIIGNLGKDPETKFLPNGDAVTNITVATSESWKDKQSGERKEKTEWHRIVAFRRLAEIMGEYLTKGSKVYIEGKLQTRKWEKDGQDHYTTEIVANQMQMLDSKGGGGQNRPDQSTAQQQPAAQARAAGVAPDFDDSIPFFTAYKRAEYIV